ncbi:MAG: hypothetical protein EXR07_02040 [Acetobacteraceae bacterium]|nr:hypothetical protein [Acetobacteraceae bacterium]
MARNLYFEFGPDVAERLHKLTARYGETSPEATVARAIGLLEAIEPYLHEGLLTVIDPKAPSDSAEDREIDLLFDGATKSAPIPQAA